jgi:nucleotide-binding universal stress UspA family protein
MTSPILLCTDGSDQASGALSAGLELLGRDHQLVLVTVMDTPDEGAMAGSGHAGADMSLEEYEAQVSQASDSANTLIAEAQRQFELGSAEVRILQGDPGPAICRLATELTAQAIVVGSRGRGILKRALLGSVSDHIVRNAPCSVIVTRS